MRNSHFIHPDSIRFQDFFFECAIPADVSGAFGPFIINYPDGECEKVSDFYLLSSNRDRSSSSTRSEEHPLQQTAGDVCVVC
ncbi:hypothetical protein CEXT_92791 [Caerostris extrusa]|uniref:Uncharacterized protein n=1 Tax=Caerostris extrusa TaxID=172846 RepID=A0AAV4NWZ5_CAEEX|nr:hypothetical protein CEXT_92791 [Caerostris extrusa]